MNDAGKVYNPPTIADTPMPSPMQATPASQAATQASSNGVTNPATIQDQPSPTQRIAVDVLGNVLNTQNRKIIRQFTFTPTGALQIGTYSPGESGDVRISPDGIVARDQAGNTTFSLDGDTGDATFAGTLQTGALIAGQIAVGNDAIQIDGDNKRIVFFDDTGVPSIVIGQP